MYWTSAGIGSVSIRSARNMYIVSANVSVIIVNIVSVRPVINCIVQ